jgi:hypothetical protein
MKKSVRKIILDLDALDDLFDRLSLNSSMAVHYALTIRGLVAEKVRWEVRQICFARCSSAIHRFNSNY